MRIIRLAILIFLLRIMRPISQRPEIPGFCREMGLEKSVPPQSTDFRQKSVKGVQESRALYWNLWSSLKSRMI